MTATVKRKYQSPRQLRRRANILDNVRSMLQEGGYEGMTIRELADRADVAQGTLYNLYGGKDSLILAAVDDQMTKLIDDTEREIPDDGIGGILALVNIIGERIQANPDYADAMARILFHIHADDPLADVVFARSYPFTKSQLEIAQRNGEVRPEIDTDIVARHLFGQGWSVTLLWMMGKVSLEDVTKERNRSALMTLFCVATDSARKRLQAELAALDEA